jgi:hypothetical protein
MQFVGPKYRQTCDRLANSARWQVRQNPDRSLRIQHPPGANS